MPSSNPVGGTRPSAQPLTPAATPAARGPVLVASDGTDDSLPALTVARLLAARGATIQVIGVLEPAPYMVPWTVVPQYSQSDIAEREMDLQAKLREQARQALGAATPAAVETLMGQPAETLARAARERQADLMVTGVRHRGPLGRMLHGETPLGIARTSRTPVLVVSELVERLPRTVLVVMDLDEASVNAARRARPLLADAEKVYVLHVRTPLRGPAADVALTWDEYYARATQLAFERIVEALDLPATVSVETRTVEGHPVEAILDFAGFARAELIVSGFHRRMLFDRLAAPRGVAERVFRGASCSVLLVPAADAPELPLALQAETDVLDDRAAWPARLADFTSRNAGRAARLEIDTAEMGAQAQVEGYALAGVDFDPRAGVLHLMFGKPPDDVPQLAHNIPRPQSLAVERTATGRDLTLRIGHEGGYSLLTFVEW